MSGFGVVFADVAPVAGVVALPVPVNTGTCPEDGVPELALTTESSSATITGPRDPFRVNSALSAGQRNRGHAPDLGSAESKPCERPHYWQELLAAHGYACDDDIRWAYWDDESVEWWYRQNMFVARRGEGPSSPLRSVVHPALLESTLDDFYSGRVGLRIGGVVFVRALVNAGQSRARRLVVHGFANRFAKPS